MLSWQREQVGLITCLSPLAWRHSRARYKTAVKKESVYQEVIESSQAMRRA